MCWKVIGQGNARFQSMTNGGYAFDSRMVTRMKSRFVITTKWPRTG